MSHPDPLRDTENLLARQFIRWIERDLLPLREGAVILDGSALVAVGSAIHEALPTKGTCVVPLLSFEDSGRQDSPDFQVFIDEKNLPFPALFDGIFFSTLNRVFSDLPLFLKRMMECLRPGGHLFFIGLGEGTLLQRECADFSSSALICQQMLPWQELGTGDLREEWVHLDPTFSSLMPSWRLLRTMGSDQEERALDASKYAQGGLADFVTLHLLFGHGVRQEREEEE